MVTKLKLSSWGNQLKKNHKLNDQMMGVCLIELECVFGACML